MQQTIVSDASGERLLGVACARRCRSTLPGRWQLLAWPGTAGVRPRRGAGAGGKQAVPRGVRIEDSLRPRGFAVEVVIPLARLPGYSAGTAALRASLVFRDADQAATGTPEPIEFVGTIALGGYDYHGQGRATGELRDLRAGRCMGACLEYAARRGMPLMLYVFSDGSISASGQVDSTTDGRGKFMWTSDNQSTAASFFLVYNPGGRPNLVDTGAGGAARHQQIGYFRADASVETASSPAAANVNLLVETVVLNYMALHGEQAQFASRFPRNGLGNAALQDSLIAFNPIVSGRIG